MLRHAIDTPEVAAVGDGHPEVGDRAAVTIDELWLCLSFSWLTHGLWYAPRLECDGLLAFRMDKWCGAAGQPTAHQSVMKIGAVKRGIKAPRRIGAVMRTLMDLLQWLALRARVEPRAASNGAGFEATTADRAARLVPVPDEALEPEVGRSLIENGALWLLIGSVLLLVGIGYLRRRWRGQAPVWARFMRFAQRKPR